MLVATDYFSKWVKVEAFIKIKAEDLIKFMKQNVIYKFGISKTLVMDNGP